MSAKINRVDLPTSNIKNSSPKKPANNKITHLQIAIWEHYVKDQTEKLRQLIRRKKARLNSILGSGDNDPKTINTSKVIRGEVEAMENAMFAIEALKISYIEHTTQMYDESQAKIKFLEKQWKGCWDVVIKFREAILSSSKSNNHA
jgi:phage regulator Rha-like protein